MIEIPPGVTMPSVAQREMCSDDFEFWEQSYAFKSREGDDYPPEVVQCVFELAEVGHESYALGLLDKYVQGGMEAYRVSGGYCPGWEEFRDYTDELQEHASEEHDELCAFLWGAYDRLGIGVFEGIMAYKQSMRENEQPRLFDATNF